MHERCLSPQVFPPSDGFQQGAARFMRHQLRRQTEDGSPTKSGEFVIGLEGVFGASDFTEIPPQAQQSAGLHSGIR